MANFTVPQFDIFVMPMALTPSQSLLLDAARKRCQRAITGGPPALGGTAKLQIKVQLGLLPGGIAETDPTSWWTQNGRAVSLPCTATITVEKTRAGFLEAEGRLLDVFTHEIVHGLGFGCAWSKYSGLIKRVPGQTALFTGRKAVAEYQALLEEAGRSTQVVGIPIESEGSAGQLAMHWREHEFGRELMTTKLLSNEQRPLSRMSIAALADLGYAVDLNAGEPYSLPPPRPTGGGE